MLGIRFTGTDFSALCGALLNCFKTPLTITGCLFDQAWMAHALRTVLVTAYIQQSFTLARSSSVQWLGQAHAFVMAAPIILNIEADSNGISSISSLLK